MISDLKQLIYRHVPVSKNLGDVDLKLYLKNRDQSIYNQIALTGLIKPFTFANELNLSINYSLCVYNACVSGNLKLIKYLCTTHSITPSIICMHFASSNGHIEICKYLNSIGVNFNFTDLCNAIQESNIELIKLILNKIITGNEIGEHFNDKVLKYVCRIDDIDLLNLFISYGFKCKPKHFVLACKYGCTDNAKKLYYLKKNVSPSVLYNLKVDVGYKNYYEIYAMI
jgi:hypothetical protein